MHQLIQNINYVSVSALLLSATCFIAAYYLWDDSKTYRAMYYDIIHYYSLKYQACRTCGGPMVPIRKQNPKAKGKRVVCA